jgi:hypothetical protein
MLFMTPTIIWCGHCSIAGGSCVRISASVRQKCCVRLRQSFSARSRRWKWRKATSSGKIAFSRVPGARATTSTPGERITTAPGVSSTGAMAASAPSTTSPMPCCTRASGRCRTGFSPPFCRASLVHPGTWPGRWDTYLDSYRWRWWLCNAACPMRCTASWRVWLKRSGAWWYEVNSNQMLALRSFSILLPMNLMYGYFKVHGYGCRIHHINSHGLIECT